MNSNIIESYIKIQGYIKEKFHKYHVVVKIRLLVSA